MHSISWTLSPDSNHPVNDPSIELVHIRIKAVPGASRDSIAGMLGDRLKIRISALPEAGKANKAICKLIANSLSIKPSAVTIHAGHTNPEKTIQIAGASTKCIAESLNIDPAMLTKLN